jgi:hypothetical protein
MSFNAGYLPSYSVSFYLDRNFGAGQTTIHISSPSECLLIGKQILVDAVGENPELVFVASVRNGFITLESPLEYDHHEKALCVRILYPAKYYENEYAGGAHPI